MNIFTKTENIIDMIINKIEAKSLLRKYKKIESWFVSRYGFNLYRGCVHNCIYCDGRAEQYKVNGNFGTEITIKSNALELLDKELNPIGKRKPLKKGFIMIGGGVGDFFQLPIKEQNICRNIIQVIQKYNFPIHILTKSDSVTEHIDLIKKSNQQQGAIVSFSFSSVHPKICEIFEPGVPSPDNRLSAIKKLNKNGIATGAFLMPVLPFISDSEDRINESVRDLKNAGVNFIIFGGLTLKKGRQRDFYYQLLKNIKPSLIPKYENLYGDEKYGSAKWFYYKKIEQDFIKAAKRYKIPMRIPPNLYKNIITEDDLIIVTLEHIDFLLKQKGKKSPYGYAAYSLSKSKEPIRNLRNKLTNISGVGNVTSKLINEILDTGKSKYLENLLFDF